MVKIGFPIDGPDDYDVLILVGTELRMEPTDFRSFADECVRLAQQAQSVDDRSVLLSMAQAWIRLADKESYVRALLDTERSALS